MKNEIMKKKHAGGRPRKEVLSFEALKKQALQKYNMGIPCTLEETAAAIAPDEEHMLSKMAIYKIEKKALAKIKWKLKAVGINQLDDVIEPNREELLNPDDLA